MNHEIDRQEHLNGKELRDRHVKSAYVKCGNVVIVEAVSHDYEKYQMKNHPDTVDVGVTVVMGAPFPGKFRNNMKSLIELFKPIFKPYDVTLHCYSGHHLHATVSPLIRTCFDPELYLKDRDAVYRNQQQAIQSKALDLEHIKNKIRCTQPFYIAFCPLNIKILGRGEILAWGEIKDDDRRNELAELRKRLGEIAGSHSRDKGSKVHIALATIEDFHLLTGLQKKEISSTIHRELESFTNPDSVYIDRVRFLKYLHRSLARVESSEEIIFCPG